MPAKKCSLGWLIAEDEEEVTDGGSFAFAALLNLIESASQTTDLAV